MSSFVRPLIVEVNIGLDFQRCLVEASEYTTDHHHIRYRSVIHDPPFQNNSPECDSTLTIETSMIISRDGDLPCSYICLSHTVPSLCCAAWWNTYTEMPEPMATAAVNEADCRRAAGFSSRHRRSRSAGGACRLRDHCWSLREFLVHCHHQLVCQRPLSQVSLPFSLDSRSPSLDSTWLTCVRGTLFACVSTLNSGPYLPPHTRTLAVSHHNLTYTTKN